MGGIIVYDSYAKLTGNTKITDYHNNKQVDKVDPYILFEQAEVKQAVKLVFSDKPRERDF